MADSNDLFRYNGEEIPDCPAFEPIGV